MKRICIIDDHPLIILGYKTLIQSMAGLECVGEASTLIAAQKLIQETQPDVAVIDIAIGHESGLDLLAYVLGNAPDTAALCMSMHSEEIYGEKAALAGALGYVNKQSASRVFLDAIQSVAAGKPYFSTKVQKLLLSRARGESRSADPVATLTMREAEILRFVGLGMTKYEISVKISRSPNTVEAHRTNIKRKLGIETNNGLIRLALSVFPDIQIDRR